MEAEREERLFASLRKTEALMNGMDRKLDRVIDDIREVKGRLANVEENLVGIHRHLGDAISRPRPSARTR